MWNVYLKDSENNKYEIFFLWVFLKDKPKPLDCIFCYSMIRWHRQVHCVWEKLGRLGFKWRWYMGIQTCPAPKAEYANYFCTMSCFLFTTPPPLQHLLFNTKGSDGQSLRQDNLQCSDGDSWDWRLGKASRAGKAGKFSSLKPSPPPLCKQTYLQLLTLYSLLQA